MTTEATIHFNVVKLLSAYARRDVLWFHIPNGEKRTREVGARLKLMGVMPGASDLLLIVDGEPHFVELKARKGRLSPAQDAFHEACQRAGAQFHCVRSVAEAASLFADIGALRLSVIPGACGGREATTSSPRGTGATA